MKRSPLKPSAPLKRKTPFARVGILASESAARLRKVEPRKCKVKSCRKPFVPAQPFIEFCSPDCGAILALERVEKKKEARAKAERAADRIKRRKQKTRKWWLAKAKTALHAFIRARDEGKECISCDTILLNIGKPGGDYDAGHFRSVGSAKHLEFDERNIFGQCKHCNDHLKGNQLEYERRLRIRRGDEYVDAIKADQEPRHLTISDFDQIEVHYKAKLKALKASQS
jgi:hypothetical protein